MAPRDFNSWIYHFWVQLVSNFYFGDFWAYFGHFCLEKKGKNKASISEMKTCSYQKWQETKLALKFNFTKENMCPLAFLAKLTVGQCSLWALIFNVHQHLPQVHQFKDTTLVAQKPHITSNQEGGAIQFSDHYPPPYTLAYHITTIYSNHFCLLMFATTLSSKYWIDKSRFFTENLQQSFSWKWRYEAVAHIVLNFDIWEWWSAKTLGFKVPRQVWW